VSVTSRAVVRPIHPGEVHETADLLRNGDFGERLPFLEWAVTQPTISTFVAEVDGRIAGSGVASAQGNAGWVGVIFVAPELRGAGLGRQITRAVIDDLEARGCRTQILIASPMGRPIYEREGFVELDRQVRFTIDGLPDADAPVEDARIRSFEPRDMTRIIELDRYATGEDRRAVLADLVTPASTLVTMAEDGSVTAFLARAPWRGGALIALDPDDAVRLLERRRRSTGPSGMAGAGVLASNAGGRERLRAAGWREELGGVRMIRGEPLDWHPNTIFGQFNGALG
jgi:GNAT superfamily N-acetyltransferase